ncbi:unnamed protein product [Heligmosomoides polygyrus]|uniref:Pentatricopeptide repeat-containing protein n=1 Tax=Heligmosomoides polygyrus TaxID=6339 RepID=A0A183GTY7_HELPZ|nr:unnamed protein product [Heligmosomoides polygyrus]
MVNSIREERDPACCQHDLANMEVSISQLSKKGVSASFTDIVSKLILVGLEMPKKELMPIPIIIPQYQSVSVAINKTATMRDRTPPFHHCSQRSSIGARLAYRTRAIGNIESLTFLAESLVRNDQSWLDVAPLLRLLLINQSMLDH